MIRNIQKLSRIEFITLLIIAILLLFSIAIFFYTYYKSEIVWNGKKSDYYNLYYSISLIFIIINSTLLFANSLLQRYFVIIVLSIIFATYLVETYFTLIQLKQKKFALIKNENNQTYQAYLKFKNGDKNVRVPVPPSGAGSVAAAVSQETTAKRTFSAVAGPLLSRDCKCLPL